MSATNPKVVIEILSPSTRHYDRDSKFQHYSQISSIEEYILIEQHSYSIERRRRLPDGQWEFRSFHGEDAILELSSVKLTVPLRQIYTDVPFEFSERDHGRFG